MRRFLASTLLVTGLLSGSARAVTFDWAYIGNPGNADDISGYGGVDYGYRIGKHEVTNAQYTEFLNAVDPTGTNTLSLYDANMNRHFGGISSSGQHDGSRYQARAGREQHPVTFVSFLDAMRFINWLHNGQGSGGTESGVYTIGSGTDEVRSAGARYWIPSEDEWYKAAYYDPQGVYYGFPTGADAAPYSSHPASLNTPDNSNAANYFTDDSIANAYDNGYAVSGSRSFDIVSPLTDVGAYSLAASPYGTFDQGGNVWEWNERVKSSSLRGLRGGSWYNTVSAMSAAVRSIFDPSATSRVIGFRVASIPEPSTIALLACAGLVWRRRS